MRSKLILLLMLISGQIFAQNNSYLVPIGNFITTGGRVIHNCNIGYHTLGKPDAKKSNVILWLTWYTGTSEGIAATVPTLVDTTQYYVIIVDALGNGVSSSPSNTKDFPLITIRDMVNTEHDLLTKYLNINHVKTVMGISMGGMQTLEWLVAYPDFMDKAVSIVGTPKQSFYDLLLWNTELGMIKMALKNGDKTEMQLVKQYVSNIDETHLYTPAYFVRTQKAEDFPGFTKKMYEEDINDIANLQSQIQAMLLQDIYKSAGKSITDIRDVIKARVLIIVSLQDHMVNPQSSIELSKQLSCQLEAFDCDCGHNLFNCGREKANEVISSFLKKETNRP